jgi:K(+)-stimulated pyrophosphate-energized sodium pump
MSYLAGDYAALEDRNVYAKIWVKEGKANPDLIKATRYAVRHALESIAWPAALIFFMPVFVAYLFDFQGLMGLMLGVLLSGFLMAFQYGNTGGALGNVKNYIEKGFFGGPGTPTHRTTLVADTFGDALKDSLGPAMNIMVKLVVLHSLIIGIFLLGG